MKSDTGFRSVPKSMTLNVLERRNDIRHALSLLRFLLQENNVVLSFSAGFTYLGGMCTVVMWTSALNS